MNEGQLAVEPCNNPECPIGCPESHCYSGSREESITDMLRKEIQWCEMQRPRHHDFEAGLRHAIYLIDKSESLDEHIARESADRPCEVFTIPQRVTGDTIVERCKVCGWPLRLMMVDGCTSESCSMR